MRKAMRMTAGAAAALLLLGACGGSGEGGVEAEAAAPRASESSENQDGSPQASASGAEVTLQTFRFEPGDIEIAAGESVTWTNNDDILHTVTSGIGQEQGVPGLSENKDAKPDGLFDQQMDGVGATFEFTFEEAGTYDYFCAIHPGMTGKVIVR